MRKRVSEYLIAGVGFVAMLLSSATAASATEARDAQAALERAGAFFRDHLGVGSTYVWKYAVDGSRRDGEGGGAPDSIGWVQPPGTPSVGAAFLRIHEITGDKAWLDAAHGVATALVRTQLLSGGWFYKIETDPAKALGWCYRGYDVGKKRCRKIAGNPDRNKTVLDDNTTQSVFDFLMWFDRASGSSDPQVGEAVRSGLGRIMDVQYPNGALPVFFGDNVAGRDVPTATKATIPGTWPHEWVKPDAPPYFIVNDNLLRDAGRMFLHAYRQYGTREYLESATRIGDFLLAAQFPAPQQGWAQIYDRSLQPVWGRRYEPPGVVSHETAGCIEYLIELYGETGRKQYLDAAASAGEWLDAARLPNGRWARFYELNTNRPLYVDEENRVTFGDADVLSRYGMQGAFGIEKVLDRLRKVRAGAPVAQPNIWISDADDMSLADLESAAKGFVESLDAEGRWVDGDRIDSERFIRGVFTLARLVEEAGEGSR